MPLERILDADAVDPMIRFERTVFPAPVDMALDSEGHLWITSGLAPKIRIQNQDSELGTIEFPNSGGTSLASIKRWREHMIIVDFTTDTAHLYSTNMTHQCSIELGDFPDEMEGASAPTVFDDSLYYLLSLSGVVKRLPLSTTPSVMGSLKQLSLHSAKCPTRSQSIMKVSLSCTPPTITSSSMHTIPVKSSNDMRSHSGATLDDGDQQRWATHRCKRVVASPGQPDR